MIDISLHDVAGKTVLDLGGYRGDHALLALRQGAASAIVVDNREWEQYIDWTNPINHHAQYGVQYVTSDLMDWHEPADVVVCSNVIYHAKDPFAMLAHLRKLAKERLFLRTSYVGGEGEITGPEGWTWYPDGSGHENKTVWCRPSPGGLKASLKAAGFAEVTEQGRQGDHIVVEAA